MKKIVYAFAFSLIFSGFISCNEKPKKDIIITKMPPKTEISKNPLQVGDYSQSREVEWVGSTYTVEVNRKADSTLTIVKDENGQKYYDNRILVRILRKDGSEFFNRAFTKNDFDAYVDALYKKNSVLLGIVLDKADADNIYLAASVGSPEKSSDEFVPLVVKVSRMGQVTISKDTQLDTSNDPSSIVVEEKEDNSQQEFEDDGV
ncbi:MAG: DUF4738 domain-containing protein [Prevotella sp.]|nr:DUF4738 domain-containing protein [Prevotella sp.]